MSEVGKRLARRLTDAYSKEDDSNNVKLLEIPASELSLGIEAITDVSESHNVNQAAGKSLEYIGALINTPRKKGETDLAYAQRLRATVPGIIGGGTKAQLIAVVKEIVPGIDEDDIIIDEPLHDGAYGHIAVLLRNIPVGQNAMIHDAIVRAKAAGIELDAAGPLYEDTAEVSDTLKWSMNKVMQDTVVVSESFSSVKTGYGYFAEGVVVSEYPDPGAFRVDISKTNSLNKIK